MTRVSQTRPGHGSGCPWVRVRVTVRAPVTRAQPISKATANAGPQQPTKANAGPRRRKRAQTMPDASFGPSVGLFFQCTFYFSFFYYYEAHEGPQQPTTANAGQRRPTQVNEGPQQPTKSNAGPRR